MTTPVTLATLAPLPLWVGWQTEDRATKGGTPKPTKVPYARDGRKAEADDPRTWATRPEAEAIAARLPKPYGFGGVGLELTALDDGTSLFGLDLDTCRNPETGCIEGWAEDQLATFDSYAEVSPSQAGVKAFCLYETAALPEIRRHMGTARFGKKFASASGDHPPAIEPHFGNRYFAVTDQILPRSRAELRLIDTSVIVHLLTVNGPQFANAKAASSATKKDRGQTYDRSRSADAFRIGQEAVRSGATFDQMCDALRTDPTTTDWMREKGEAANFREARRIFEKSKATGPVIQVIAGKLHETATAGEEAIIAASLPIFQRGTALVRPIAQEVPAAKGRTTISAALHEIGCASLIDSLCSCATWERFDSRADGWLRINPPKQVAETLLSRAGQWNLPKIIGVVTCPTLRPNGSILEAAGYDPATRLFHVADSSLRLTDGARQPSRAAAEKALADLIALLAEFPFADERQAGVSRAVALSALITPVVRGALTVSPLHAFRASTAGTGKSYLVDTASAIATGRPCPVSSAASSEEENEKRLAGLLLHGFPLATLDNVNGELGGDLLCQAIERPLIRLRRLGGSAITEIESRSTLFATGNALRVRGDMCRRCLICDLDAGLERPELRTFAADPVATVMADRGRYVSACLAIPLAYLRAGTPALLPPLASFGDWSALVRSALVWLGESDPAASMETARDDDPDLEQLRALLDAWQTLTLPNRHDAHQGPRDPRRSPKARRNWLRNERARAPRLEGCCRGNRGGAGRH